MGDRTKNILTVIGMIAFVWLLFYYFYGGSGMHERGKYSVGRVTGTHWAVKSGTQVDYAFTVNNKTFRGGDDELPGMNKNASYLVKYDSLDPAWNVVYYQHPIPDSIAAVPLNGWALPPFPVPAEVTSRHP